MYPKSITSMPNRHQHQWKRGTGQVRKWELKQDRFHCGEGRGEKQAPIGIGAATAVVGGREV